MRKKRNSKNSSRNATTHGMRQEHFSLLPNESQAEFDAMAQRWRKEYLKWIPGHPALDQLLIHVIERDWVQTRCLRSIDTLQIQLFEAQSANDLETEQLIEKRLQNAYRYKTSAENSFTRAYRSLEQFRHTRVKEHQAWKRLDIQHFNAVEKSSFGRFDRDIDENHPDREMEPVYTKDIAHERDDEHEELLENDARRNTEKGLDPEHTADEKREAQGGEEEKEGIR